jgi:hypothetical protein
MKRLVVPTLILVVAFFTFPHAGGTSQWPAPVPSLGEMKSQIQSDLRRLAKAVRFQRPSLSPLSIPYLTIMEAREEAALLQHEDHKN